MIDLAEEFTKGYEEHIPPVYKIEYFMTQKEYTKIMNAIDCFWMPSNVGNFTFWKHKINSRLSGHIIRVKINP
jgi:hypothetical protein